MPNLKPWVFANANFVVADKSAGWLTTPAREATDPRPCLGRRVQEELGQRIYPVHRLDFEVSGLVLFALTPPAHREGQRWFETGLIQKTYQAVSASGPAAPPREWTDWRSHLAKGKRRAFKAPHGKSSWTRARAVSVGGARVYWELMPMTGRPHQLRVEMADHGWPILGDVLYGGAASAEPGVIALRAWRLDLTQIPERLGLPERLDGEPLRWA